MPTAEQIRIPATLSPEEVGRAVEDRFSTWAMAGAGKDERDAWLLATDDNAVLAQLASQNAAVFADNLFVAGWRKDQGLSSSVAIQQQNNLELVRAWNKTFDHTRGAKEAYHQWVETTGVKVISSSPTGGKIDISYIIRDNVEKNHVDDREAGIEKNINRPFTDHVTYIKEGDSFKIASFAG